MSDRENRHAAMALFRGAGGRPKILEMVTVFVDVSALQTDVTLKVSLYGGLWLHNVRYTLGGQEHRL